MHLDMEDKLIDLYVIDFQPRRCRDPILIMQDPLHKIVVGESVLPVSENTEQKIPRRVLEVYWSMSYQTSIPLSNYHLWRECNIADRSNSL